MVTTSTMSQYGGLVVHANPLLSELYKKRMLRRGILFLWLNAAASTNIHLPFALSGSDPVGLAGDLSRMRSWHLRKGCAAHWGHFGDHTAH